MLLSSVIPSLQKGFFPLLVKKAPILYLDFGPGRWHSVYTIHSRILALLAFQLEARALILSCVFPQVGVVSFVPDKTGVNLENTTQTCQESTVCVTIKRFCARN